MADTLAQFIICSSTEQLDLLRHFQAVGIDLGMTQYKGGGVFKDSPFTDTRSLIFRRYTNAQVSAQFTLNERGSQERNTTAIANDLQRLRRILEAAANFWASGWMDNPVWIEVRVEGELSPRYAYVALGQAPRVPTYYEGAFHGPDGSVVPYLPLVLERQHWLTVKPGDTPPSIAVVSDGESFNSLNYGPYYEASATTPAETTGDYAVLACRNNVAQVSHIFTYDSSAATYSTNKITGLYVGDQEIAANPHGTGDITYFGSQTSITGSGPFWAVVLNISVSGQPVNNFEWEYSQGGGAWGDLTADAPDFYDATNDLQTTGYQGVYFSPPDAWAADTVNGVTAFWIRHRSTTGLFAATPEISAPYPFTPTWPYVELDGASYVDGDMPAIAKINIYSDSAGSTASTSRDAWARIILGMRSTSRGENFSPFLNFANVQNAPGVGAGASRGSITTIPSAPAGSGVQWASGGVVAMGDLATITINKTYNLEYRGRYRLFIRVRQTTGTSASFRFRVNMEEGYSGAVSFTTPIVGNTYYASGEDEWELIDLGSIDLLAEVWQAARPLGTLRLVVQGQATASDTIQLADMILLPTDEWSGEVVSPSSLAGLDNGLRLEFDATTNAKKIATAKVYNPSTDDEWSRWQPIIARHPLLVPRTVVRFYALAGFIGAKAGIFPPAASVQLQFSAVERYFDLRGAE